MGLCRSTSPGACGLQSTRFPPLDALLLFLQNLASVTGVSPYSDEHLAFGIWDTELVTGRLMSWPWGGRLDGFSFAPQKHCSSCRSRILSLCPLTKRCCFFGAGKLVGMMMLCPVLLLPSLFRWFGHISFYINTEPGVTPTFSLQLVTPVWHPQLLGLYCGQSGCVFAGKEAECHQRCLL